MLILRLVAAGVLVYAGLRLRKYLLRRNSSAPQAPATPGAKTAPVEDILMEDPICQRLVPKKQAITVRDTDGLHHFCSEDCRNIFLHQREKST
ncbi:MAG: hypothetical protein HQQ73_04285 [Desulfobulbaceae bacterium]|nr:hypothetical protein [Desulfobulbaceae bacterium]